MTNNKLNNFIEMATNEQKQKEYKDNMARKTSYYQKKFNFDMTKRPDNYSNTHNNEADAFKHAYGGAYMALYMGQWGSFWGGVQHEAATPNNPPAEWNMDSWNNNQGRIIAKEIEKEYGKDFYKFPRQKQEDIIAVKVMMKMRNGELITHPNDSRKYNGWKEKPSELIVKGTMKLNKNKPTGFATPIENSDHIFTPQEIGDMTAEEFTQNEATIMQQMKAGLIQNQQPKIDYTGYKNPISNHKEIFTREDIAKMSTKEFSKYEKAINAQMKDIGIPSKNKLPKNATTHTERKQKVNSNNSADGKWITINGNHVLIDK